MKAFPTEVITELKTYVYRLIDPRNGETFYVGKGKGNRVFAHVQDELSSDDPGDKLTRIRDIRNTGMNVGHVIHRHGMDSKTAFEVEAALIDAYPGLTNIAGGAGSGDFGSMHAAEVIQRYQAKDAKFTHKVVMITVNRTAAEGSLYEAVRYAWKISPKKASRADYVLAVVTGMIREVFEVDQWMEATAENFPGREPVPGRHGFVGHVADKTARRAYNNRRVPKLYRKRGAANPIKYSYT